MDDYARLLLEIDSDDPEFPFLSHREREAISEYLKIERELAAPPTFYAQSSNVQHRNHAVSVIAKLCHGEAIDAYIPYLAMNYFDRFVSTNSLTELRGSSLPDKVRLVAICCFTLAAKMRRTHFRSREFLMCRDVNFNPEKILNMEFRILSGLDWRMRSVTPFQFLDHYYPKFRVIGGFKRRSINEIIVQSQGEVYFTQFKPSDIAICALLAAAYLGYPSKFSGMEDTVKISDELVPCYVEMVRLCQKRSIEIRSEYGTVIFSVLFGIPSSSGKAAGAQTQTTKYEEELGKAVEFQVQKHTTSPSTQFWNAVLENDDEEEDVAPLTHRRRRDKGKEAVKAPKYVVEVETEAEANKQGEEQENAASVSGISEEKDVESGTGAREDKDEGASEEFVEAETGESDDKGEGPSENFVEAETGENDDKGEVPSENFVEAETGESDDKGEGPSENFVEAETGESDDKGEGPSENFVEAETGARGDKCEGPSQESVQAESRARKDKGKKKVEEILQQVKVEEESKNPSRRRKKKRKDVMEKIPEVEEESEQELEIKQRMAEVKAAEAMLRSEIGPAEEAAPLRQMNFQLQWPITVRPGEIIGYIDESLQTDESRMTSVRCPTTIRGTGNDPPLVSNRFYCIVM